MNFTKLMKSLFGDKSTRDMKLIQPYVDKIKAAYPAIGGGVGAGMPDHNRGFVFVGGIVAGNRGNLLGGNRYRAPAVVRASASAEDFMAHGSVSKWVGRIMRMGSLKNF